MDEMTWLIAQKEIIAIKSSKPCVVSASLYADMNNLTTILYAASQIQIQVRIIYKLIIW